MLFLAVTAAPAGLLGKAIAPRSMPTEVLTFSLIVLITSLIAVTPSTLAALRAWMGSPNNLSPLVDLALYQAQALAAATVFAGLGWAIASWVQGIFED